MEIKATDLAKNLQQSLKPCYLFFGDELVLIHKMSQQLLQHCQQQGYDCIKFTIDGNNYNWQPLMEAYNNNSLFTAIEVIVINLENCKINKQIKDNLNLLLNHINNSKILLFTASTITTAEQKSSWFKQVNDNGIVIKAWQLQPYQLPAWVKDTFSTHGIVASNEACQFIATQSQGNLAVAEQEIIKLSLQQSSNKIDIEDVINIEFSNNTVTVYDLVEIMLQGKLKLSLDTLLSLQQQGVAHAIALWAVVQEIRKICLVQAELNSNDINALLQKHKIWGPRKSYFIQAVKVSANSWQQLLQQATKVDNVIKGISAGDAWLSLQVLCTDFVKLCNVKAMEKL